MKGLRDWFGGLPDRERKLFVVFLFVLSAFVLVLVPYLVSDQLANHRARNEDLRKAIRVVQDSRERFDEAKGRHDRILRRYDNPAPALAGFIENAASKSEIEIPESKDGPETPHGKKKEYMERSTEVRLRKVKLLPLVTMLETLENAGHPIVVSRLNVKRRPRELDSYDVILGVSAFDRDEKSAKSTSTPSTSEAKP